MEKNNEPHNKYKIVKKLLSIIREIFLLRVIFIPVNIKLKGISREVIPNDWKKISAEKLPRYPRRFFIWVLSGKIKLGSSGEKLLRETNKRIPIIKIHTPKISTNLLKPKIKRLLANFFNSINQ